jgi:hypothetical protein
MVQPTGMTGEDQPRVRDAVIGAAFGVLLIWLKGPDVDLYWYCDYVDGELSGLSFDS